MVSRFFRSRAFKGCCAMALTCGGAASALAGFAATPSGKVLADHTFHPPKLTWPHSGFFNSLDHHSVRRGYEVYKNVCSACHSMKYLSFRNLVGVSHSEEEAKELAEDVTVEDGPDDSGEMFERPGKLSDRFPSPYANDNMAKSMNNGAIPPDLSTITLARNGGEDYVFHLLTGYCDPPAGVIQGEGQYYNPYMSGGFIAMGAPLYSEIIDYEDGTPASLSQLAKDVCCFLRFASEPEFDERKRMALKAIGMFVILLVISYYMKRHKWSVLKSRQLSYHPKHGGSQF